MPAYKAQKKKSTSTNKVSKKSAKQNTKNPNSIANQIVPYALGLVSLFLVISYFAGPTGFLGGFLRNTFFGLFSSAAWIVPIVLVSVACFWKNDVANNFTGWKIFFSLSSCVLVAVLIHVFSRNAKLEGVETFNLIELFKLGLDAKGGGAIGGLFGNALWALLGFAGTLIFSIALILLFAIFLFGMTPHVFSAYIVTGIRAWKAKLSENAANAREEKRQRNEAYAAANSHGNGEMRVKPAKSSRRKAVPVDVSRDEDDFYDAAAEIDSDRALTPIDPEIFDEIRERESARSTRRSDTELPFDVDGAIDGDTYPEDKKALRSRVKPMEKTGEQELAELDDGNIDLSKIFVEPKDADSAVPEVDGDVVTSAEIDLMIEKSRLTHEENSVAYDEDELSGEENLYAEVSGGKVSMEPIKVPDYTFPPMALLKYDTSSVSSDMSAEIQHTANKLVETLRSFNVKTKIINVSRGPTITRYELQPEIGTKVRSIVNLVDDIALHLATSGVRIEAPIPGKEAVGIEVPNRSTSTVYIRELLEDNAFKTSQSKVTTALGMDVAGAPIFLDIAKMPHLLIAGTTGSGKSVCINSLIVSILYKARPDEVKFIMIDPKKVELNVYNGIPHLLVPVVSDPKKAAGALHWAVSEMERRYELIEGAGVRNIKGYNQSVANDDEAEKLPQIVIVIDELADLMMMARDDVEEAICRIAQKARAAGMHLVIGTQRPSVDVVTGLIKANVPSRIAFTTANQVDSRTIIDCVGAEKLIGRGDMLYAPIGSIKPLRVQGCFVSDDEVEEVAAFIKNNYGQREYDQSVIDTIEREAQLCGNKKATVLGDGDEEANDGDPMLRPAIQLAVESGKISTSLIQRRLQLGYGRAAKLIDTMEQMGIVSAPQGQKPRDVLISKEEYLEMELRRGE